MQRHLARAAEQMAATTGRTAATASRTDTEHGEIRADTNNYSSRSALAACGARNTAPRFARCAISIHAMSAAPAYTAPTPATLGQLLQPRYDARPAIVIPASAGADRACSVTYAQLRSLIEPLQRALLYHTLPAAGKAQQQTPTRVAMSLPNGLELVAAFLAVTNSRAVAAPLNPAYTQDEVKVRGEATGLRQQARGAARCIGSQPWQTSHFRCVGATVKTM